MGSAASGAAAPQCLQVQTLVTFSSPGFTSMYREEGRVLVETSEEIRDDQNMCQWV
jgi:hypothetical protein